MEEWKYGRMEVWKNGSAVLKVSSIFISTKK